MASDPIAQPSTKPNQKLIMRKFTLPLGLTLGLALCPNLPAQTHLTNAENLVLDLVQSSQTAALWPNVYGLPEYINWNGPHSTAKTECSSFATLLLEYSYGWTATNFVNWMGHASPDAAIYHDTIAAQKGFKQILTVDQIHPGDFLAIVYYPEYQSPSGHVMLVQDLPQPNNTKPLIAGTTQWTIPVIDSSSSYHGTNDTRYHHPGGIGYGTFRLYAKPDGTVAGYTWSLLSTSTTNYVPQATSTNHGNHLVIGRLN